MARRSLGDIEAAFRAEYQQEEQKVQVKDAKEIEAKDGSYEAQEKKSNLSTSEKTIERELEAKAEDIKEAASKEASIQQDAQQVIEKNLNRTEKVIEPKQMPETKNIEVAVPKEVAEKPEPKVEPRKIIAQKPEEKKETIITARKKVSQETLKRKTEVAKKELEEEMQQEADKAKKQGVKLSRVSDLIFYGSLVLMLLCVILYTQTATGNRSINGARVQEVTTTSMESEYPKGSLVSIKETDPKEIVVGDDIAFSRNSSNLMIQRVIEILENHNDTGEPLFITGTLEEGNDSREAVSPSEVAGKVTNQVSKVSAIIAWIVGNPWIVMVIFLGLMALSFYVKMLGRRKITKDKESEKKASKRKNRKSV